MSISALNSALKVEGYTPTAKFILVVLANYADEWGSCFPSHSHIAKIVGLKDTKGVARYIKQFEQDGLLSIQSRKDDNGGYTSNRYILNLTDKNPQGVQTPRVGVREPSNTKDNTKNIYTKDFEDFWKKYPRKISKKSAFNSYKKAVKNENPVYINLCALRFAESCKAKNIEEQYIPHASTWLNQERWTDVIITKIKTLNNLAG